MSGIIIYSFQFHCAEVFKCRKRKGKRQIWINCWGQLSHFQSFQAPFEPPPATWRIKHLQNWGHLVTLPRVAFTKGNQKPTACRQQVALAAHFKAIWSDSAAPDELQSRGLRLCSSRTATSAEDGSMFQMENYIFKGPNAAAHLLMLSIQRLAHWNWGAVVATMSCVHAPCNLIMNISDSGTGRGSNGPQEHLWKQQNTGPCSCSSSSCRLAPSAGNGLKKKKREKQNRRSLCFWNELGNDF